MKRFFFFVCTLSLAALGWVLWQQRGDLKRSYGEWRSATDAAGMGGTDAGEHPEARSGQQSGPRVNGPVPTDSPRPAAQSGPGPRPAAEPVRCAATTGSGKRCTRPAEEDSRFCWQHAG